MAHHMLEKMIKEKDNVEVYSCGIYADSGEPSTYNAIEIMKEYGIDMKNHRASNIKETNIEQMDLILCATVSHKQLVLNMYPDLVGKVYTIKEYKGLENEFCHRRTAYVSVANKKYFFHICILNRKDSQES